MKYSNAPKEFPPMQPAPEVKPHETPQVIPSKPEIVPPPPEMPPKPVKPNETPAPPKQNKPA